MPKTIEISDETFEKLKDQLCVDSCFKEINKLDDMVGEKYFFRTVTYHLTGKMKDSNSRLKTRQRGEG